MMLLKDGDDALLGRHVHGGQMASEPWNDEEREGDLARLLLSVGDRTMNGSGYNCLYSMITPCYKLNGRSRTVYSPARVKTPESRFVSKQCPDAPLSTSQVAKSLWSSVPLVGAAAMKADPPPLPNAPKRPKVSSDSPVCCGGIDVPI